MTDRHQYCPRCVVGGTADELCADCTNRVRIVTSALTHPMRIHAILLEDEPGIDMRGHGCIIPGRLAVIVAPSDDEEDVWVAVVIDDDYGRYTYLDADELDRVAVI